MIRADELVNALLENESPKDFVKRHIKGRSIRIKPDPSHSHYYQIPIPPQGKTGKFVNLFKAKEPNPGKDLKERLRTIVMNRKGFVPGDVFLSPWGNFKVTDTMDIENA